MREKKKDKTLCCIDLLSFESLKAWQSNLSWSFPSYGVLYRVLDKPHSNVLHGAAHHASHGLEDALHWARRWGGGPWRPWRPWRPSATSRLSGGTLSLGAGQGRGRSRLERAEGHVRCEALFIYIQWLQWWSLVSFTPFPISVLSVAVLALAVVTVTVLPLHAAVTVLLPCKCL